VGNCSVRLYLVCCAVLAGKFANANSAYYEDCEIVFDTPMRILKHHYLLSVK
jgi:hypothetical protein